MASRCKHCLESILWIPRNTGGFFPPFDQPEELTNIEYNVSWNGIDWIIDPVNRDITARMRMHDCKEQRDYMASTKPKPPEPPVAPVQKPIAIRTEVEYIRPNRQEFIKLAIPLSVKCPTCLAREFEWCVYQRGPREGAETERLHGKRWSDGTRYAAVLHS